MWCVVIPAFNEAESIGQVVERASAHGTVIVVDDASSDDTAGVAGGCGAHVVVHPDNQGYDGAIQSGFAKAVALGADYIITLDADGQHDPELIRRFQDEARRHDMVLGIRPQMARFSERVFARATHKRFGIEDPLCGMKAYAAKLFRECGCFDSYRSIGTELMLFAVSKGHSFTQIAIPLLPRQGATRFGDGLRANLKILRAMRAGQRRYF